MGYTGHVSETSFTVLHEPKDPDPEADVDIVFVHGFTGHPRDTWTLKNNKRKRQPNESEETIHPKRPSKIPRLLSLGRASPTPFSSIAAAAVSHPGNASTGVGPNDPASSAPVSEVFWPGDLLRYSVPTSRILTFGYDTRVRHHVEWQNSQNTVVNHAKDFLSGLEARRRTPTEIGRPILFVVHSLGGIVVKEALRQSKASTHMSHLYSIYERTIGSIFFGTPHRDSDLSNAYRHLMKLGEVLGWKPNTQIADTLAPDSKLLASLREEFPVICHERKWLVQSFQEEYGLAVLGGKKVVDDTSSCLNDPVIEAKEHIASNHFDMCRFFGLGDPSYQQVTAAITRIISTASRSLQPDHISHQLRLPLHSTQSSLHQQNMEDDQADHSTAQDTSSQHSSTFISGGLANSQASKGSIDENLRGELVKKLYFGRIDERLTGLSAAYGKTCRWFLDKSEYQSWLGAEHLVEHGGLLWIKGNPGTGKSTLMKFLFEKAKRDASDDPSHIHISFFFNARGDADEKSTIGLYRSLLHQLFEHTPDLAGSLNWMTLDGALGIQRSGWHEEALRQTLKHATDLLGNQSLTIFVDALDECDQTQVMRMVESFEELCGTVHGAVNLRICFSSRHYPSITIQTGLELVLEHEAGHNEDIRTYIKSKLRLGKTKQAESLRAEILEMSAGIFLWIVLVIEILNREFPQGSITQFRTWLHTIQPKLHELFETSLKSDGDNLDQLRICFNLILFAKRPLKLEELYFAIQLGLDENAATTWVWNEDDISIDQMKKYVSSSSKGLAQVTRNKASRVQFIHESVRDFLLGKHGSQWSQAPESTEGSGHEIFRDCCLAQLKAATQDLPAQLPKASESARMRTGLTMKFPFLEYSVQHVLYHSDMAQRFGIDQSTFLSGFPFAIWVATNNALERYNNRRYTQSVSMLYVLAENNLANLIAATPHHSQRCFEVEQERYGTPILAALANGNSEAVQAMYSVIADHSLKRPTSRILQPHLFDLQTELLQVNQNEFRLPLQFKYNRKRSLSWHVYSTGNTILLSYFVLYQTIVNSSESELFDSALFLAAQNGNLKLAMAALSSSGHDLSATNSDLPIQQASKGVNTGSTTVHQKDVSRHQKPPRDNTALWWAEKLGHEAVAQLLRDLESGNLGSLPLSEPPSTTNVDESAVKPGFGKEHYANSGGNEGNQSLLHHHLDNPHPVLKLVSVQNPDKAESPLALASSAAAIGSLSLRCQDILTRLSQTLERMKSSPKEIQNASIVFNALGRFNVWTSTTAASSNASSLNSLDWYLRTAPTMAERFHEVLKELYDTTERAHTVCRDNPGVQGARDLPFLVEDFDAEDPEDREIMKLLSASTSEFDTLVHTFEPLLDRLFRLASFVRQDITIQTRKRLTKPRVLPCDQTKEGHLIHLRDKYKKLAPWLVDRLGLGFEQRRAFLLGRQAQSIVKNESGAEEISIHNHPVDSPVYQRLPSRDDTERDVSIRSQATSFTSACVSDEGKLHLPDLEMILFDGRKLQYGELFLCPFCRERQSIDSPKAWRKHVLLDLMPYMCLFEDCSAQLFLTRQEWFQHELDYHRRIWTCLICNVQLLHGDDLAEHFQQSHPDDIFGSNRRRDQILENTRRFVETSSISSCPFCDDWTASDVPYVRPIEYRRHVGRHQQQLALEAVPLHIEGLVILHNEDDKQAKEGDFSSIGTPSDAVAAEEKPE